MSILEAMENWRQDLVLQGVEKVLEDALELVWYVKVVVGFSLSLVSATRCGQSPACVLGSALPDHHKNLALTFAAIDKRRRG